MFTCLFLFNNSIKILKIREYEKQALLSSSINKFIAIIAMAGLVKTRQSAIATAQDNKKICI